MRNLVGKAGMAYASTSASDLSDTDCLYESWRSTSYSEIALFNIVSIWVSNRENSTGLAW